MNIRHAFQPNGLPRREDGLIFLHHSASETVSQKWQSFSRVWEEGTQSYVILLHVHCFEEVKMALIRL